MNIQFELMQRKLSCIKRKRMVFFEQTLLNLLSECYNFHFRTQYLGCPNNLKNMETSVILSMYLLGHLTVIES